MPSSINIWRLSLIPEKAIDEKIQRLHLQSKKAKRNNLRGKEAKAFEDKLLRLFEAAAKVDENIKRKKASDNKMATLDEANDNFDNLDVGDGDFEHKEQKKHW